MTDDKPKEFFDEEKKKKVVEWITQKCNGGNFTCECCGHNVWTLSPDLVTPLRFSGGFMLGGNSYPSVLAICSTCGNTKLFNAMVMGVLQQPETKGIEGKKEGEDGK